MGVPAVIRQAVELEMPLLSNVLAAHPQLPPIAFQASFYSLVQGDRTGKLAECTLPSLIGCLATSASLGLMMQPQLGQFFILPFRLNGVMTGTPCVGVKGYNTLAARDDYTINGKTVREQDFIEYEYGSNAFVRHRPVGPRNETHRIIGSWSLASHMRRPAIVEYMEIEELMAVKNKSPAVKFGGDTPYKDDKGIQLGLTAMFEKTPKRRLARSMPLNSFVMAHAVESRFEATDRPAFIIPNQEAGIMEIVDGQTGERMTPQEATQTIRTDTPKIFAILNGTSKERVGFDSVDQWRASLMARADRITTKNGMDTLHRLNAECLAEAIELGHGGAVADIERYFEEKKTKLP